MLWAKELPAARINLARSGVAHCPPSLLAIRRRDVAVELPVRFGYEPLRAAIAERYAVGPAQVFTVSGGTTLANWFACATALEGAPADVEAIVERPTYEPLLRVVEALGCRVRRLERRFEEDWRIDLDRFASLVTRRTRLAIVTNLHNPSGARIDRQTLRAMAAMLKRVGAWLLVDEVYLECLFGPGRDQAESCVHAGSNVITTNSLTKAYGLDGLRAGWMLGPRPVVERAWQIHALIAGNGVAAGERLALRAFERLGPIGRRARRILSSNLRIVDEFLRREPRLSALLPPGGNVVFPRVAGGIDADALADHLRRRYSTLVVPGRFFEAPRHLRISFGCPPAVLRQGLDNLSRTLDDLTSRRAAIVAARRARRARQSADPIARRRTAARR
jgi:aspartate/methionine/tyrosine aminotransferase